MLGWKERGFVPDSDEEELEESQNQGTGFVVVVHRDGSQLEDPEAAEPESANDVGHATDEVSNPDEQDAGSEEEQENRPQSPILGEDQSPGAPAPKVSTPSTKSRTISNSSQARGGHNESQKAKRPITYGRKDKTLRHKPAATSYSTLYTGDVASQTSRQEQDRSQDFHWHDQHEQPLSSNGSGSSALPDLNNLPSCAIAQEENIEPQPHDSSSSSDLSDVDMELLASSQRVHANLDHINATRTNDNMRIVVYQPIGENEQAAEDVLAGLRAPARTFRARRAIQLHPYLIEQVHHTREFTSHGLKPVRMPNVECQMPVVARPDLPIFDTADSQYSSSTQSTIADQGLATPMETTGQAHFPRLSFTNSQEDEFPDLDRVLGRHISDGVQEGSKRRRIDIGLEENGRIRDNATSTAHATGKLKRSRHRVQTGETVHVPPSPPRTSSPSIEEPTTTSALAPHFRVPRGLTPTLLDSPRPSSSDAPVLNRNKPLMSPEHRGALPAEREGDESATDTGASSASDIDADQIHLQRLRKRIKGVLPASWLKLDKASKPTPVHARTRDLSPGSSHASPVPSVPLKGIAQRRAPNTSTTPRKQQTLTISSDSESSDGSIVAKARAKSRLTQLPKQTLLHPFPDDRFDEVFEHDEIDDMRPAAQRHRKHTTTSPKRQSRLTDTFLADGKGPPSDSRHTTHEHSRRRPAQRPTKRAKRKHQSRPTVKLSILDVAPSPARSDPRQPLRQPPFVRLAARQARRRPDHGRHSPTQKIVRLATREDTQDAQSALQSWQSGKLHRTWTSKQPDDNHPARAPEHAMTRGPVTNRPAVRTKTRVQALSVRNHDQHKPTQETPGNVSAEVSAQNAGPRVPKTPHRQHASVHGSLDRRNVLRPAHLETGRHHQKAGDDSVQFSSSTSRLAEIFSRDRVLGTTSNLQLDRYLHGDHSHSDDERSTVTTRMHNNNNDELYTSLQNPVGTENAAKARPEQNRGANPPRRRQRKRQAQRFDVELVTFRQPSEPLPGEAPATTQPVVEHYNDTEVLKGLGFFGTRYSTDFDVRPLEIGTFFHQNTFIGSREFHDCLCLGDRDLDLPAGRITIEVDGQSLRWSAWDEEVATGLNAILATCTRRLTALSNMHGDQYQQAMVDNVAVCNNYLLRSIIRYCSGCLHFLDPVDRISCIDRLSAFVDDFVEVVTEQQSQLHNLQDVTSPTRNILSNCLLYLACVSSQIQQIADSPFVDTAAYQAATARVLRVGRMALSVAFPTRLTQVREYLEENRQHTKRHRGIQENETAVKCVVMLNHLLHKVATTDNAAGLLYGWLHQDIHLTQDVQLLDQVWYDMFSLQPLLEIDSQGIYRPGSRFQSDNDGWKLITLLLKRVFDLYYPSVAARSPTLNEYVRACLIRCHILITRWNWRKCETMLSTVYDFFARNGLSLLVREESRGSPRYLEQLEQNPVVEPSMEDSSFHIFLKLIVAGLRSMQTVYPVRKIQGIAWRFVPNHGRMHQKDQEVDQAALDALRNHHDLLCSLYWILPAGLGPRLQTIQELVDHSTSHREACRISISAWANLARFIASTEERSNDLESIATWYKGMAGMTMSQYRLARTEAEEHYASEKAPSGHELSSTLIEATISSNQRAIVASLLDLLQAMQSAMRVTKSWDVVHKLTMDSDILQVFAAFDAQQPKLCKVAVQGLRVVDEILLAHDRNNAIGSVETQEASEESQDYGEWDHLDEVDEQSTSVSEPTTADQNIDFLTQPLARLLSTCFGSEKSPDDNLLQALVTTWTKVASRSVQAKAHDWSHYLGGYGASSWFQLRSTEQKRKYTSFFLASLLDADSSCLHEHRNLFLSSWLESLLERESLLKFQHYLTASLLNKANSNALLYNPPFAKSKTNGHFEISLAALRERRLSMIGCVLSNMHSSLDRATSSRSFTAAETRRDFVTMLRKAMSTMRSNYEELQETSHASEAVAPIARGTYVSFVQQVISLMQQYTSDICPIDSFFIDSAVFPLPANDPTYVVGRLKSYTAKLSESKARKQLAVFLQTVSERAATDGQQPYLIRQLTEAMSGAGSSGLRHVYMTAFVPAYVEAAASSICGWVVALPLLQASSLVFERLVYELDLGDKESVPRDVAGVYAVLDSLCDWLSYLLSQRTTAMLTAHNLRFMLAIFAAARNTLTLAEYLYRRKVPDADALISLLRGLRSTGMALSLTLRGEDATNSLSTLENNTARQTLATTAWSDTREYSKKNLVEELDRHWTRRGDGEFGVQRGGTWRPVGMMDLGSVEEEREKAVLAIKEFVRGFDFVVSRRQDLRLEMDEGLGEVII